MKWLKKLFKKEKWIEIKIPGMDNNKSEEETIEEKEDSEKGKKESEE